MWSLREGELFLSTQAGLGVGKTLLRPLQKGRQLLKDLSGQRADPQWWLAWEARAGKEAKACLTFCLDWPVDQGTKAAADDRLWSRVFQSGCVLPVMQTSLCRAGFVIRSVGFLTGSWHRYCDFGGRLLPWREDERVILVTSQESDFCRLYPSIWVPRWFKWFSHCFEEPVGFQVVSSSPFLHREYPLLRNHHWNST